MSNDWYIAEQGRTRGPFADDQMVEAGLDAETQVWSDGMADWRAARDVPQLVALLPAPGAPREELTAEYARPIVIEDPAPGTNSPAGITLIPCPGCGVLSDSIKNYRMASFILFLVFAAAWRTKRAVGCPRCVRKDLVKTTLITAIPSTLLFPLVLVWHGTLLGMTYCRGHSRSIREALA